MKVAVCFLTVIFSVTTLPVEVAFETPDELDLRKLTPKNVYVKPVNSTAYKNNLPLESKVVGGTEVIPNSVPYQVVIIINSNGLCGGSLISTNRVLTAAHCTISASFVQVRLGAHYFNHEEETQVRITSTSIKNHDSYNPIAIANDISIVFLPSSVTINNHIQVVPLAPADSGTFEDSTALLAGWGRTTDASNSVSPVLRAVYLRIISNGSCRNIFGGLIVNSIMCTSGVGAVGACNGDSGGALVVDGVQVGITSFGTLLCEDGSPTGYTRISSFRTWIYEYGGV